jgi:ribosomal protein S18 acetylase RimI-like enzyme
MSYIDISRKYSKNGKEILVRNAHPSDAPSIISIKKEVISEKIYMLREEDEAQLTEESETKEIREHLDREGSVYIVAEHGENIAGFLEFLNGSLKRTKHAGMLSVYLRNDYREDGIGSMLMEELIHWAQNNVLIEKLTLAVFSINSRAIGLYRKHGFEVEGICPKDMKLSDGVYIDSVLMYRFVK